MRDVWKIKTTGNDLQVATIPLARIRSMGKNLLHIVLMDTRIRWINAVMDRLTR